MIKLENYIRVIEGFPNPEISFKDISPLLADKDALRECVKQIASIAKEMKPDLIIGPEARGFVIGSPVAYELGVGFAMARKHGKLPGEVLAEDYDLEYGKATIELPAFALKKGQRVVLIDDLLATGGTLQALVNLVEKEGAKVVGIITVIELEEFQAAKHFSAPYHSLIRYYH